MVGDTQSTATLAQLSADPHTDPPPQPDSGNDEKPVAVTSKLDIEHATVRDDPRKWSKTRKYVGVAMVSLAAMVAGLGANIYNPAISQIEADLHATPSQLSLTLSLFILIQGGFPLIWSAVSEVQGRKRVYLVSLVICTVGCIVSATAKSINVLIGMRCVQAAGSSAVISIGAATLADMYDPADRGTMMGIYYCAPLLGPSLGPILGGVLTQGFNWRATFWFLAIFTGFCAVSFLFFKDTFRLERSLTYQTALRRLLEHEAKKTQVDAEKRRHEKDVKEQDEDNGNSTSMHDVEAQAAQLADGTALPIKEIKLSLMDINPVRPIVQVLRRQNNIMILVASGKFGRLLFAFNFSITYTAARTLADQYHYDALKVGLALLAYGVGCLFGSILGGRYSDYVFKQLKAKFGDKMYPEARMCTLRLQSTLVPMLFFPPSVAAYGWVCERHVSIAAVCVMLFLSGFFQICIYTSTLAYIVDANVGRSSSAVASNSFFRGLFAFVATEIAVPLQDSIGDGGLYSMWTGLLFISEAMMILVWWKGREWREKAVAQEARRSGAQ
ncbi:uncharacterized protein FIBRA_01489 [Fibroporia radiculosa]|uniref:Major facilitator superfamily (MFS) profile domain-containing protein n=1 Tax=Fibroporia radiculosa TaxID=599839 RepID=J4I8I5_9APHY|nr:uncharacterized protein FIBRA_01489 [Fibroporia radiculosa]CCL99471.1 predicted protein [Fibroporia radiculosa]